MSAIRFLAADKLASWLAGATISPKAAVFPACETLVHFTGTKDPENPAKLNMKLDDTPDAPARMVFG